MWYIVNGRAELHWIRLLLPRSAAHSYTYSHRLDFSILSRFAYLVSCSNASFLFVASVIHVCVFLPLLPFAFETDKKKPYVMERVSPWLFKATWIQTNKEKKKREKREDVVVQKTSIERNVTLHVTWYCSRCVRSWQNKIFLLNLTGDLISISRTGNLCVRTSNVLFFYHRIAPLY